MVNLVTSTEFLLPVGYSAFSPKVYRTASRDSIASLPIFTASTTEGTIFTIHHSPTTVGQITECRQRVSSLFMGLLNPGRCLRSLDEGKQASRTSSWDAMRHTVLG
ncbi:unnamed protein product [Protopolystoma xenopodis]|uniref:Uncharacterized protein n=1 Tax=Protopolystoma xenopodis TaxID=117903 RepID=A0A3S5BHR4_9PLAT|nr:unnamed protein product [Protopolystoma xenopodis]